MILEAIKKCPLFAGIEKNQIESLLDCLSAKQSRYKKDEFVFRAEEPAFASK